MKRILSVFLSGILIVTSFAFAFKGVAAETSEIFDFPCGLNATAYLDRTSGILTVKGSGDMNFFYDDVPW